MDHYTFFIAFLMTTVMRMAEAQPECCPSGNQVCCKGPNFEGLLVLGCSSTSNCNVGTLQCCNTVASASSAAVKEAASLLGVTIEDTTVEAGLSCTAMSVVGCGR